jgi:hypothetical protein
MLSKKKTFSISNDEGIEGLEESNASAGLGGEEATAPAKIEEPGKKKKVLKKSKTTRLSNANANSIGGEMKAIPETVEINS